MVRIGVLYCVGVCQHCPETAIICTYPSYYRKGCRQQRLLYSSAAVCDGMYAMSATLLLFSYDPNRVLVRMYRYSSTVAAVGATLQFQYACVSHLEASLSERDPSSSSRTQCTGSLVYACTLCMILPLVGARERISVQQYLCSTLALQQYIVVY